MIAAVDATGLPDPRAQALAKAWTAECGTLLEHPMPYVVRGWTPEHVRDLFRLARHAVDRDTGLTRIRRVVPLTTPQWAPDVQPDAWTEEVAEVAERLALVTLTADERGGLLRDGWAWLAVLVGAPTPEEYVALLLTLRRHGEQGRADWAEWAPVRPDVAPWAWAAGLSSTEAVNLVGGAGDVRRLRGLAGLRGWVLPEPDDVLPAERSQR
jgi:hypothetical protein